MNDRITEIRQRCENATEGPWKNGYYGSVSTLLGNILCRAERHNDSIFIAYAREDIPFLLSEIDRLTKERDAAISELCRIRQSF